MLELDLRYSKDKQIVVFHDDSVDRITNYKRKVEDFTLGELESMGLYNPDGSISKEGICSFGEFLHLVKSNPEILLNIEIKPQTHGIEDFDEAIGMLESLDMFSQIVFTSFDFEVLKHVHTAGFFTQAFTADKLVKNKKPEEPYSYMDAICPKHLHPQMLRLTDLVY